jgi:hypothetical protein
MHEPFLLRAPVFLLCEDLLDSKVARLNLFQPLDTFASLSQPRQIKALEIIACMILSA